MAIGSGMAAQIMWAVETTAGVPVTPTAANPLISESLTIERERLESAGIIASRRVLTSDQWNGGNITVGGDISLELYNRGLGKLFRGMFGAVNTTGAGPYTHVFTPGDLSDDVLTVQVGLPGTGGTVHPKTVGGAAVASWEIAGSAGEIVTLGATLAAMNGHVGSRVVTDGVLNTTTLVTSATAAFTQGDVGKPIYATGIPTGAYIASVTSATNIVLSAAATATASSVSVTIGTPLATATYLSTQKPVKFAYGSLSLFGSSVANCKAFTISGNNTLADDRRFIGTHNRALPIEAGLREYTGSIELEFDDVTQWNRYAAGTEGALSLVFTVPGTTDTVTVAGNVRYDSETPQVGDRSILSQNIPIKFVASGADATAITATLVNSDSTP
jgi:hypothetical protein